MKSIVVLGAFALLIVLALGDVPQESSQDIAEASELGLLEREAREARRKRRKGKGKKGKGKAKGKGKGRKVRKGKGNGKKSIGNGKGKGQNNKGKGTKSGKRNNSNNKASSNQRQTTTNVPADDVKKVFSGYRTATNRLRQIKRTLKFEKQIKKKEDKAASEFTEAAKALDTATGGGSYCNGAAANSSIKAMVLELKNCSKSAAAMCVPPVLNQTGPNNGPACEALLEISVNSTRNWLQNPSSATFNDVVYADPDCVKFAKDNEAAVKAAKEKFVGSTDVGSFGACSAVLKKAAGLIIECGTCTDNPPPATTSAPSGRHRIFKFQQQLF